MDTGMLGGDGGTDAGLDSATDVGPEIDAALPDVGPTPDASTTMGIGPAGGTVSAGAAGVTIPAGALSTNVSIGVAAVSSPLALPAGYTAVSPYWAFTPHGTAFTTPASITIQHSGGADAVLRLDSPTDTAWDPVTSPTLTATDATFATSTFSFYVVVHATAATSVVHPFYTSGPAWNDYVANDGADGFSASNTACTIATSTANQLQRLCLHGGEMRAVDVPGHTSCAGLAATDALGAFDWTCVVRGGNAVMVSLHLKDDVPLATLIDFAAPAWRTNTVSVTDGGTGLFTTPAERWWSNPIVADDDGGTLSAAGTLYVVRTNPTADYVIGADHIGLVVQPGHHLGPPTASSMGLIRTGTTAARFAAWIEGDADGADGVWTLRLVQSVLRNVHLSTASGGGGIALTYTFATRIDHLWGVCAPTGSISGALLSIDFFSFGEQVHDLRAARCRTGLSLRGGRHVVDGATAFSGWDGLDLGAGANVAADITVVNNGNNGITQQGSNAIMQVTAANNVLYGIWVPGGYDGSVTLGAMAWSNRAAGFALGQSDGGDNDFWDVVSYANTWFGYWFGMHVPGGFPGLRFHGRFGTGQTGVAPPTMWWTGMGCYFPMPNGVRTGDCGGSRATTATPGPDGLRSQAVAPYSCEIDTNSDASYLPLSGGGGFMPTRVPPVDEPVNTSDVNGVREFANITDWFGFAGPYRAWGAEGSATPNCFAQGPCDASAMGSRGCQIYDYTLIGMTDEFVCARSMPIPTGNDVITWDVAIGGAHGYLADDAACMRTFSQASILPPAGARTYSLCHVTFQHLAREISGDLIGNDNLLCESGETCLFTPNIASYQGHGPLISAGTFVDGTVHGVTLLRYTTNGVTSPWRP